MDGFSEEREERRVAIDSVSPCDRTSYLYFSMALFLFVFGAVITFFSIDETIQFNELDKIWFFGPLFITSGLMVAVKTLIYLKRKSLIAYMTQQRIIIEGHCEELAIPVQNTCPLPSYEATVGEETPPPTYQEALLILSQSKEPKESAASGTTPSQQH